MKAFNRTFFLIIAMALMTALASCGKEKAQSKAPVPAGHEKMVEAYQKSMLEAKKSVAAKVNGVLITMFDLVNEMNAIAPQYVKPGQKKDADTDKKIRKEALDRLIYRELAVQEAERQGMKVSPQNIGESLKKIRANMKSEEEYKAKLSSSGLTEDELKKQIERDILIEMITEKEIFGKVKVDPKQVEKAYEKDKASYKNASGRQLSLDEARPLIEEKLMRPLVNKREDEWVAGLKKSAKIEITLEQVGKDIHPIN